MSAELTLEERVRVLEAIVRDLQRQLAVKSVAPDWLERVTGTMKDNPNFETMLEYGRQFRQADRPAEDAAP